MKRVLWCLVFQYCSYSRNRRALSVGVRKRIRRTGGGPGGAGGPRSQFQPRLCDERHNQPAARKWSIYDTVQKSTGLSDTLGVNVGLVFQFRDALL